MEANSAPQEDVKAVGPTDPCDGVTAAEMFIIIKNTKDLGAQDGPQTKKGKQTLMVTQKHTNIWSLMKTNTIRPKLSSSLKGHLLQGWGQWGLTWVLVLPWRFQLFLALPTAYSSSLPEDHPVTNLLSMY